jgi:LPXTG-site transpeptidase (sortase) family protein
VAKKLLAFLGILIAATALVFFSSVWANKTAEKTATKHDKPFNPYIAPCSPPPPPVKGVLYIPKLGMVSPVAEGNSDEILSQYVGHNPATVWPGGFGTSELSAHDVSQFVLINQLNSGDEIDYYNPCSNEIIFHVIDKKIINTSEPVWGLSHVGIILETCWPPNTLEYTNQRLLVEAVETKEVSSRTYPALIQNQVNLTVNLPPGFSPQDLTLQNNYAPVGQMIFAGNYETVYIEGPGPLQAEAAGLQGYLIMLKALEYNRPDWWSYITKTVAMPSSIIGAGVTHYDTKINVTVGYDGSQVSYVGFSSTVTFTNGTFNLDAIFSNQSGVLYLTQLQL